LQQQVVNREPSSRAVVKIIGTPPPIYFENARTDGPLAIDMRDSQLRDADITLKHVPSENERRFRASMMYIGGRGPGFHDCPCGLKGVRPNKPCPKCGKRVATADEMAASVIRDLKIEIRSLDLDADGSIRNKHFYNCDFIGPAIIYPPDCSFSGTTFNGADSVESIIWPPNPAAKRSMGVGFTGNNEMLHALRACAPLASE
jgi:hypothetical protein